MVPLMPFEIEVVSRMTADVITRETFARILDEGEFVDLDNTGVGYFFTFRHDELPLERQICGQPMLTGEYGETQVGFMIFLENHKLTLECYSFGEVRVPNDFRSQAVSIRTNPN